MPAPDRGCLSLRRPAAVKTWLSHGHMYEPLSWDHPWVSLSPEPGLDALPCLFPGHDLRSAHGWAGAPHPGMGAAPGALWPCGRVLRVSGPVAWLEPVASCRPEAVAAAPALPRRHFHPSRQEAALLLFFCNFWRVAIAGNTWTWSKEHNKKERGREGVGEEAGAGEVWKNHLISLCKDNCNYVSEGFEVTSDSNHAG